MRQLDLYQTKMMVGTMKSVPAKVAKAADVALLRAALAQARIRSEAIYREKAAKEAAEKAAEEEAQLSDLCDL